MIQFERTNEKGDKVTAYTHENYLSGHFKSEMDRVVKKSQTWAGVVMYGTTIASYWVFSCLFQAFNNVAVLNNFVATKLTMKGKYLVASAGLGLFASALSSIVFASSIRGTHENLLRNEVFPAWTQKERVVNPDRVFFELDDSHHNEPTIWHTAM
jgi:hypothetical protein